MPLTWRFHQMPVNTHTMPNTAKQASPGMRSGTPPPTPLNTHANLYLILTVTVLCWPPVRRQQPSAAQVGFGRILPHKEAPQVFGSFTWHLIWLPMDFSCWLFLHPPPPPTLAQRFILVLFSSGTHSLSPPIVWIPSTVFPHEIIWKGRFHFCTIPFYKVDVKSCTAGKLFCCQQFSCILRHWRLVFFSSLFKQAGGATMHQFQQ